MGPNKKTPYKKEMKEELKLAVEHLVGQEIRLLQFDRVHSPSFILEELSISVKESKKEVIDLTQSLAQKERTTLIKKMFRETVDEEIERTVQHRGNPCLRCGHLRYYDWELNPHENFPMGKSRARAIGCDRLHAVSRTRCERFIETLGAASVSDYVDEMTLLYELREMFKKMREIWEEYLLR
jgi:hypothetical protein